MSSSLHQPYVVGTTIIILTVQRRKLRHKEVKQLDEESIANTSMAESKLKVKHSDCRGTTN